MPIKPENKGKYPKNWKGVRESILERARNECEFCRLRNGEMVLRGSRGDCKVYARVGPWDDFVRMAETGEILVWSEEHCEWQDRPVKVVLTIAHLDHDPGNNSPQNLRALCQRCHNSWDAEHRAETRKKGKAHENG
jgi:5-methylcytosine-specific restriction endonuclease McrA